MSIRSLLELMVEQKPRPMEVRTEVITSMDSIRLDFMERIYRDLKAADRYGDFKYSTLREAIDMETKDK